MATFYRRHSGSFTGRIEPTALEAGLHVVVRRYFQRHPDERGTRLERRAAARIHVELATFYLHRGLPARSLRELRSAMALDPRDAAGLMAHRLFHLGSTAGRVAANRLGGASGPGLENGTTDTPRLQPSSIPPPSGCSSRLVPLGQRAGRKVGWGRRAADWDTESLLPLRPRRRKGARPAEGYRDQRAGRGSGRPRPERGRRPPPSGAPRARVRPPRRPRARACARQALAA